MAKSRSKPAERSDSVSGWLWRLLGVLRRPRDTAEAARKRSVSLEPGAVIIGPVRDPSVVIPAEIMFAARRAALYSHMVSLALRNPYYLSRVVARVKYHDCDALLAVVLDSVFASPAAEASLAALFTEVIALEVDRSTSIETVMRNDAPSVHMLSAYLKKPSCLAYLRTAVGPTIDTIIALGDTSLDNDPAAVYQDWARTQTAQRLPPVASAVEAAGYTEVQNLSRRRTRHLAHLTTHFLYDIINARAHIPSGLLAICTSTLQAARRRFPQADDAQAYSLVGGIFFLRYVNAALLSPTQYGLLDEPPSAPVRSNLKLVARLLQRLSNNWGKPADEWPVDARKFVRSNARRFGLFLASLTDSEQAAGSASPAPGWPAGRGCLSVPRNIECDRWCKGKGRRREWRDPGTRVRQCVTDQGPSRTPVVRRRAATKPDRVVASSAGIKQGSPASS
ncbi:RasGAP protein, partial [Coemansia sp. RSA 2607]